ncbi:MAG: bifunctional DNA-formamidopyrimidine glycosylase/DNA-(apurinic or apyrimidinic site) lyase [bacterium]|nr:bifunctional DNA-formamidopyrimidine glycosylase/DNA-(apurinic or apyrimidinic site) lyase [bacterium]
MPELPEVETVVRQLRKMVSNENISNIQILDAKISLPDSCRLHGYEIRDVERSGKFILLQLSAPPGKQAAKDKNATIAVHLRMTGRLIWEPRGEERLFQARQMKSSADAKERNHVRVCITCRGGQLLFVDTRRFGTMEIINQDGKLCSGLEPLAEEFTASKLGEIIGSSKQPIKTWLLRQDKILGIGNIYASEILFAARINPEQPVNDLSAKQLSAIVRQTRRILNLAIENCGTTFSDFQNARGEIGNYQNYLKVYNREAEACTRCKTAIIRSVQGGRSTYFCPQCQPLI